MAALTHLGLDQPAIGILDSGVGGLSILREIHRQLPDEYLIYFADSAYAPYGERSISEVQKRTLALCDWLVKQNCKALVVACNTATAHAIQIIRERYAGQLIIIGVEPGIKPALALTHTNVIGVLATSNTLNSSKFQALIAQLQTQRPMIRFICQAGTGLVPLIEQGQADDIETENLLRTYLIPMLAQGIDTLVLGCTHYPFLTATIRRIMGTHVQLVDTSHAVSKHLSNELQRRALLNSSTDAVDKKIYLYASAMPNSLSRMVQSLLRQDLAAQLISI